MPKLMLIIIQRLQGTEKVSGVLCLMYLLQTLLKKVVNCDNVPNITSHHDGVRMIIKAEGSKRMP